MVEEIKNQLKAIIKEKVEIEVAPSEKEDFGHYSTNVAFKLAPALKGAPFEIAKELTKKLGSPSTSSRSIFAKIEAVAPGFVNFWLKPEILQNELKEILKKKNKYGKSNVNGQAPKVNLEFVSANPTGPLTMANGRSGFYGDVLANVLENAGHKVTREYYVNDAGNQIIGLGRSILTTRIFLKEGRKKAEYIDKLAYKGEYVEKLAKDRRLNIYKVDKYLGQAAAKILLKEYIQKSLKNAGIVFKDDEFFLEDRNLRKTKEFQKTLEILEKRGFTAKRDNAIWLKFPKEISGIREAVLMKSDGEPTYLLVDLAYHFNKLKKRGFDLAIDIWGADHHGNMAPLKNGVEVLGLDSKKLKIILTQLVRLVSGGKEVKMSKRAGEFVTLDELLEEVGSDAARFFFLMHSLDTHMDFDLDLAKERSQKNPVYYAQYALVRASNILRKAKKSYALRATAYELLTSDSEIKLMLELVKLPDDLTQTAEDYQVHRLTKYALELARAFHNFYEKERVIGAGGELERARLALVLATKIVLGNLFNILGIGKPKKM